MLIKTGASHVEHPGFVEAILAMVTNLPLFCGYALYGVSTVLLVLALRHGQLSLLYPVIALTYVWVTLVSAFVFHESMNPWKIGGISLVVLGVAVIGRSGGDQ